MMTAPGCGGRQTVIVDVWESRARSRDIWESPEWTWADRAGQGGRGGTRYSSQDGQRNKKHKEPKQLDYVGKGSPVPGLQKFRVGWQGLPAIL